MTPAERAVARCADLSPGAQDAFLRFFSQAREDVASGVDTEAAWWEIRGRYLCRSAAMAGYLEGLASTRALVPCRGVVERHDGLGRFAGAAS